MYVTLSRITLFALVLLSSYGYAATLTHRYKIRAEFAPAVAVSGITVAMFFAGLLNILVPAVWGVFAGGLMALIWQTFRKRLSLRSLFAPASIILLIFLCFFGWRLNGLVMKHYDNFSHWLLIVRDMLTENALPSYKTPWIVFQAYPPGTACFLYYVARIVGDAESVIAIAQALLITCFALPAFAVPRGFRRIGFPLIFAPLAVMYTANIFVTNLPVDSVLAFVGFGGAVMVWHDRGDLKKALICGVPACCMLLLIKNSGAFFAAIIIAILFYAAFRAPGRRQAAWRVALAGILLPGGLLYLWGRHTALVFDNAAGTRHALSLSGYFGQLRTGGAQELREGIAAVARASFDFSVRPLLGLAAMAGILLIIAALFLRMGEKRSARFVVTGVLGSAAVYILWCASIFVMYLTSKELSASDLASFDRYQGTILVFLTGILAMMGVSSLNRMTLANRQNRAYTCLAVILLVAGVMLSQLAFGWSQTVRTLFSRSDTVYSFRVELSDLHNKNAIEQGKKYLIYQDTEDTVAYYRYVYRYEFLSPNVKVVTPTSDADWHDTIGDYDYFILMDPSEEIDHMIAGMEKDGAMEHVKVVRYGE